MANPTILTKSLAAASANNIATSQSGSSGVGLTINGSTATSGIATLDTQRRVLITSVGNDSSITFAIVGTNEGGNSIGETVTGSSGATVASLQDYLTVSSIVPSGATTTSGVTVGTNATGSSSWKLVNDHIAPVSVQLEGQVTSGSGTWGVEYTYDPVQGIPPNVGNLPWTYATPPAVLSHATLTGQTGALDGSISVPVSAYRLTLTTGTGTVKLRAIQAGIVN